MNHNVTEERAYWIGFTLFVNFSQFIDMIAIHSQQFFINFLQKARRLIDLEELVRRTKQLGSLIYPESHFCHNLLIFLVQQHNFLSL